MSARAWLGRAAALWLLCFATSLQAHPLAPALLELREQPAGRVEVLWRTSVSQAGRTAVTPELPCQPLAAAQTTLEDNEALVQRWALQCPPTGLAGLTLAVQGLAASRITVILRIQPQLGLPRTRLLTADAPAFTLPPAATAATVFPEYAALGVEHLLTGLDHLLFVAGLFLLVHGWRQRLLTLTAFTLGHSLTLALAALGWLRLPQAWAELGIAASLLWLAVELAAPDARQRSLLARWPALLASGFGLLHGLGFAGALSEIGLPQGELPLALLAFNLGIEAGQIAVVLALALLSGLWLRHARSTPKWLMALPIYGLGVAAGLWFWQRLGACLPSA